MFWSNEVTLDDQLEANLLEPEGHGYRAPHPGALISVYDNPGQLTTLNHEDNHAEYFVNPAYREAAMFSGRL